MRVRGVLVTGTIFGPKIGRRSTKPSCNRSNLEPVETQSIRLTLIISARGLVHAQYLSPRYFCRPDLDQLVSGLQGKPISQAKELVYQGFLIRKSADGLVNLTDMWRASRATPNKQPYEWLRLESVQELIAICGQIPGSARCLTTIGGRTGSTWVIPNLAVAYAKYLSPRFHA